jgi:hypothetical protein
MAAARRKAEPEPPPRVEIRPRSVVTSTLLPKLPLPPHLIRNSKERPMTEGTEQKIVARRNLLNELGLAVVHQLGVNIADLIRAAALTPAESRDWSDVLRLIDYATLCAFQIADGGIGRFDPAPLEGHPKPQTEE